jgi:hypothetical protein
LQREWGIKVFEGLAVKVRPFIRLDGDCKGAETDIKTLKMCKTWRRRDAADTYEGGCPV